jgi:hypothetical protein
LQGNAITLARWYLDEWLRIYSLAAIPETIQLAELLQQWVLCDRNPHAPYFYGRHVLRLGHNRLRTKASLLMTVSQKSQVSQPLLLLKTIVLTPKSQLSQKSHHMKKSTINQIASGMSKQEIVNLYDLICRSYKFDLVGSNQLKVVLTVIARVFG